MRTASTSTLTTLCLAAGLVTAGPAHALGFGRVASATQLGQRLNFAALVRLDPDESLDRPCVFAEVMAGDNLLQPGQVRVTLEGGPDVPDRTVRVTTSTVIEEPVVTITVSVGCSSRTTRRFVLFIDPPEMQLAQAPFAADSALLLPQRADSQVAPLLAIVDPRAGAGRGGTAPPQGSSPVAKGRPTRLAMTHGAADTLPTPRRLASAGHGPGSVAEVAREHKRAPARHLAAAGSSVPRSSAGGRLRLDAPMARAALAPAPGASTPRSVAVAEATAATAATAAPAASGAAAAASGSDPQMDALAQQRKIQSLEDGMTRMRADAAVTKNAMAALEARLQAAESERPAGPLTLALAVLSGLLAATLFGLLWRRSRSPRSALWWAGALDPASDAEHAAPASDPAARTAVAAAAVTLPAARPARLPLEDLPFRAVDLSLPGLTVTSPSWSAGSASPAASDDEGQGVVVSASMPLAQESGPAVPDRHGPDRQGVERELSVEELIDLEQQAEFFVVLGQEDAAIDLLTMHVRGEGGASPLPYLKLLEIHRRREDRGGYEGIRESFNERFNAHAPDWEADLQHGRTLEDYPEVVDRLQRLWATPSRVMETLDASVFRRNRSDATFDLPAYRELLFLYTIARDQVEQLATAEGRTLGAVGQVDLLLPLGTAEDQADPIARLSASGNGQWPPADEDDRLTRPLDLDVTLAPETPSVRPATIPTPRPKVVASPPATPATAHYEGAETVPAALRRPVGYPDESAFVDLQLDLVGPGGHASVR